MNKKLAWVLAVIVVIGLACAGFALADNAFDNRKPSEYNIGTTWEQAQKQDKPVLALFYADWCRYCIKFMPKYRLAHSLYKGKFNFVMLNVDEKSTEKLAQDYAISGFPTVYIIDPKYDNRVLLNNAIYMDLKKFRAELDRYLRIRAILDKK
jgi:thiol-disulfide isomerase/thioredoxin